MVPLHQRPQTIGVSPSKVGLSRKQQFFAIIATVLVLSSALSHLGVRVLKIRTDGIDRGNIPAGSGAPVLVMGSSLTFFGVSFRQIAKAMQRPLVTRGVGGCSPCELETLAREVPEATRLIIGVSIFDLNENNLGDSRPILVPFGQTLSDLRASHTDWTAAKRVLWSYPLPWIQRAFPLAGRSGTVLVNLRDQARSLLKRPAAVQPEAKLSFKTDEDSGHPEKLSEWDGGRVGRNLSQLAASGLAHGRFAGPKSLALARILKNAAGREPTVVLVFPVSPPYRKTFGDEAVAEAFERAIERMGAADPHLQIVRLDREPALQPAEVFWDLVHLNDDGRRIATRRLIEQLSSVSPR